MGEWLRGEPALPLPITPVLMTVLGAQGTLSSSRILREHILALRIEEISLPLSPQSSIWVRGPVSLGMVNTWPSAAVVHLAG